MHLVVLGGFLGAGKTTTLLRLAKDWIDEGRRVGIITNDQAENLVDTEVFRAAGLHAAEVAGGCFCCRFNDFVGRAEELIAGTRPDLILAEPVGSCTDIVATVLEPLRQIYGDRFTLAPFTVVVDPLRALKALGRSERVSLSERVTYISRLQQQEAAALAINKIDALSGEERKKVREVVEEHFPDRPILMYSAKTAEGIDALRDRLQASSGGARPLADIDYDIYAAGEAELAWLNATVDVESVAPIAVDEVLLELGRDLGASLRNDDLEVAHGKILLEADGQRALLNIVDSAQPPQLSAPANVMARSLRLTINMRVAAEPSRLDETVRQALAGWAQRRDMQITASSGESFKPPRPVPTHRIVA